MHRDFWWKSQKERDLDIGGKIILWHVDPLLGNNCEISSYTMVVTRQQPVNSNRGTMFSVLFMLRCHKQDKLGSAGEDCGNF
jgi:hypothetical protein